MGLQSYFSFLAVDILAVTKESIESLFDDPSNPTRLVQPSGGVSIAQAISAATNNFFQLQMTDSSSGEVQQLRQLLAFAQGLQMLMPYFTDLEMTQVSPYGTNATDLGTTNASIDALQITDPTYKQILNDLMASVSNAAQSIVFLLN
jgi:hypothetical protein